jgi:hypothetical protein
MGDVCGSPSWRGVVDDMELRYEYLMTMKEHVKTQNELLSPTVFDAEVTHLLADGQ